MRQKLQEYAAPLAALLFAALCMNFSWVHLYHDGDSVLLPLISLDRWTPFYWGDNRYGMLIPLLASWIPFPIPNLLFQTQIFALAAAGTVVVANLFFFHARGTATLTRLGSACIALVLAYVVYQPTGHVARVFFLADPYLISLLPMLIALGLVFRWGGASAAIRLLLAAPLVFLSVWINFSNVIFAGLLALSIPDERRKWKDTLPLRIAFAAISAVIFAGIRQWASAYPSLGSMTATPERWAETVGKLAANLASSVVYAPMLLLVLAAGWTAGRLLSKKDRAIFHDGFAFSGAALVFAALVAGTDWPIQNLYEPRYWTSAVALLLLTATAWAGRAAFEGLRVMMGTPRMAGMIASLLLVAVSVQVFGIPNPWRARSTVLKATGKWSADAERLGCTHMLGDYQVAWVTSFNQRAQGHRVYAAVPRSEESRAVWESVPVAQRRYCAYTLNPVAIQVSLVKFSLGLPKQSGNSGNLLLFLP